MTGLLALLAVARVSGFATGLENEQGCGGPIPEEETLQAEEEIRSSSSTLTLKANEDIVGR